jgi:hypothetical protein
MEHVHASMESETRQLNGTEALAERVEARGD